MRLLSDVWNPESADQVLNALDALARRDPAGRTEEARSELEAGAPNEVQSQAETSARTPALRQAESLGPSTRWKIVDYQPASELNDSFSDSSIPGISILEEQRSSVAARLGRESKLLNYLMDG